MRELHGHARQLKAASWLLFGVEAVRRPAFLRVLHPGQGCLLPQHEQHEWAGGAVPRHRDMPYRAQASLHAHLSIRSILVLRQKEQWALSSRQASGPRLGEPSQVLTPTLQRRPEEQPLPAHCALVCSSSQPLLPALPYLPRRLCDALLQTSAVISGRPKGATKAVCTQCWGARWTERSSAPPSDDGARPAVEHGLVCREACSVGAGALHDVPQPLCTQPRMSGLVLGARLCTARRRPQS